MAKSLTQKRRREAEADQERRQEASQSNDQTNGKTNGDAAAAAATATTTAAPPAKKARVEERRSLFVRSLPATATSEQLTEFFSEHFPVKHSMVVVDPQTKLSRGYGFVTFTDAEDATEAKAKLDNAVFDGRRLRLDIAEPRKRNPTGKAAAADTANDAPSNNPKRRSQEEQAEARKAPKLIVRNLPWSVKTPQDLTALFQMYGKVRFADLPKSKGGKLAGFGFVTLRGRPNAERAMAGVNGKLVDGRTLAVDWAVDKQTWQKQQQGEETTKEEKEQPSKDKKEKKTPEKKASDDKPKSDADQAAEDLRNFMENTMANLDEEEDDEDEEDDKEKEDDDNSEDNSEKDWESESEEEKPKKPLMTDNSTTLFVRNLPFTTTDEELKNHFSVFGPVRYARIVMDRATDRPAGTGFVCFLHLDDAKTCLRSSPRSAALTPQQQAQAQKDALAAHKAKHSVLQDDRIDQDGRYTLQGRVLQLAQAVSKAEATQLSEDGPAAAYARARDRRHLFLLSEGTIARNAPLYTALAPSEVKMREASAKQRQMLVKNNPALHLSLTRLAVRNIPRHIDAKGLKELARKAVVGFASDVKQGRREPLSREELARGGQQDREAEQRRRAKGKGVVKQAKVIFETEEGMKLKLDTKDKGKGHGRGGRSRGYGFIEYWSHRWALTGLRWLNGHAVPNADGSKSNRLIVEFAIENANVVARRKANEDKSRASKSSKKAEDGEDGEDEDDNLEFDDQDDVDKAKSKKGKGKQTKDSNKSQKADEQEESPKDKPLSKKEKAAAKLANHQRIIGRKRMMRKQKRAAARA